MWMLRRVTLVLYAYDQSRKLGEKHVTAIAAAVQYLRKQAPEIPVSETEVKRILATWRGSKASRMTEVVKHEDGQEFVMPDGSRFRLRYTIRVAPHQDYPRSNAVTR
jgi:hypothetical protein